MFYTVMFGFSLYAYSVASVLLTNKVNNVVTGQSYTVGEIVAIAQATVTSMYTFGSVIPILPIILRARVSAKKVFDVIERKPSITSTPDCKDIVTLQKGIQFENVSFRYPTQIEKSRDIFTNASFIIKAGQSTAIVGPSGSGKSTIV